MRDGGPTYGRPKPEQRLFEITRRMSPGTVGGLVRNAAPVQRPSNVPVYRPSTGRSATIVVAASNATTSEKAGADFQCDGTADEVQINDALAAGAANGFGGLVLLTSGQFNIAANVLPGPFVHLSGMGRGVTFIDGSGSGSGIVLAGFYATLSDFWLFGDGTGTGIEIPDGGGTPFAWNELDRLIVQAFATGVSVLDPLNMVRASQLFDCDTGISLDDGGTYARVLDVETLNSETSLYIDAGFAMVEACQLNRNGTDRSGHGLHVDANGDFASIVGVDASQHVDNFRIEADDCTVHGTRSRSARQHGYYWDGSRGQLHDNYSAASGTDASNTYDAFHIAGGTGSSIQGNKGHGNSARYGIRIEATVTAALVTNNDVLSGASGTTWGTAAFSDAGTGTITTAGNRT